MFGSNVLPKPSWYEFLIGFLIWTPASKYCILQHSPISVWFYPCSYICNCLKMPKKSQINEYSDIHVYARLNQVTNNFSKSTVIWLFTGTRAPQVLVLWKSWGTRIVFLVDVENFLDTFLDNGLVNLEVFSGLGSRWISYSSRLPGFGMM